MTQNILKNKQVIGIISNVKCFKKANTNVTIKDQGGYKIFGIFGVKDTRLIISVVKVKDIISKICPNKGCQKQMSELQSLTYHFRGSLGAPTF